MRAILITALTLPLAGAAFASSDEAWAEFRTDVEAKCRALAPETGSSEIEVNPFGSDKFGAALVITTLPDGTADRAVCIYDKQAKTAEMTAPFDPLPDAAAPAAPVADATPAPEAAVAPGAPAPDAAAPAPKP